MPTYQYRCRDCDFELEAIHKMTDDNLTECPSCGHSELFKVIGSATFQFKGLGWSEGNNPHEKIDRKNGRIRTKYGTKTIDPHTKAIISEG